MIERKVRYDNTIAEYRCRLLKLAKEKVVLFYKIERPVQLLAGDTPFILTEGSVTIAYYWTDRPYNLYIWRDSDGHYSGAYFNIVKNTQITNQMVSFEDLIIDVLILPSGECFILDEEELPVPLAQFEEGYVRKVMQSLMKSQADILRPLITESKQFFDEIKALGLK
ncbi:DUF402 domain-containing protein [Sporolactobacillus sp. THM7-4]|nr:DUF402 domain-containing protein [Sporolactobacillus sp. THM7-4]